MCRHCERIKEDIESKPIIHAFMAEAAKKLNRNAGLKLTADDIDVHIDIVQRPAFVEMGSPAHIRAMQLVQQFGEVGGGHPPIYGKPKESPNAR